MSYRICGLLLATYFLAWLLPWSFVFGDHSTETARGLSKVLLALLLVLGSAGPSNAPAGTRLPLRTLAGALVVMWLASLAGMLCVGSLLDIANSSHRDAIRMGLLIVSVMPVASATIAWANLCRADRTLSLLLLIASTVAAPFLSLLMMQFVRILDSGPWEQTELHALVWNKDAIVFLICWVLIPASMGVALFRFSGADIRASAHRYAGRLSLPILLILNYINASNCLPFVPWNLVSAFEFLGAVIVFQVAAILAFAVLNRLGFMWHPLSIDQQRSIALAVLLKNTGAALVLISSMVAEPALLLLPVLMSTLTQHLGAALIGSTDCALVDTHAGIGSGPTPLAVRSPRV